MVVANTSPGPRPQMMMPLVRPAGPRRYAGADFCYSTRKLVAPVVMEEVA